MKSQRFDGSEVRIVLTGMILDQVTLSRISGQWSADGLFDSRWANLIGGWCVKYFKKYSKPPGSRISRIFELWAQENQADDKTVSLVENFLTYLSDEEEHTELVSEHVIDIARVYFQKVRLKRELEAAVAEVENGRIDEAQERVEGVKRVNLGVGSYVNASQDMEAWLRAFNQEKIKPLVTYPGDYGVFLGDSFSRGRLFSFVAPDKTGKTTHLLDFAYRAVRQRNNVAYFDLGDSNEDEIFQKLAIRTQRRPELAGCLKIPVRWNDDNKLEQMEVDYDEVDPVTSFLEFKKICKNNDSLRISCHLNSSATCQDVDGILQEWGREGWLADVVVMDYADILAKPRGIQDKIEAIDETWKALRRMSQQRHCLVMTATQSKATGYLKTAGLLGPEDFSGAKAKNAHVNGMMGINVSAEDKELGCSRINWVVRRKGTNHPKWWCKLAGVPLLGNPAVLSRILG